MVCFLSRRYRPNNWPAYILCGIELGLTVALLALTGIASPNLYRTKLWQDGADNNFNSSPLQGVYAAANYRPYKTPMVWSQFLTNYNLVVVVLSMFLLLCKSTMYMLHVFPPVCSAVLHGILSALYAISVAFQASSDTTDPRRPQNGPAWFITKSCNVASNPKNIGYCLQGKALFACTVVMLSVMVTYLGFAIFSCFPSKKHQVEYLERQKAKKERWAHLDDMEENKNGNAYEVPNTPDLGKMNPMTPRTLTFNLLGGTKNQSRTAEKKSHFSSLNPPNAGTGFALQSPGLPRSPLANNFDEKMAQARAQEQGNGEGSSSSSNDASQPKMYFPPPPKKSAKK